MTELKTIPIEKINIEIVPPEPSLLGSLENTNEQIEPISLRLNSDGRYGIVDGRRRTQELIRLGYTEINALIYDDLSDKELHRNALILNSGKPNYMDEADHVAYLHDQEKMEFESIAELTGLNLVTVYNRYNLSLKLIPEFQQKLRTGELKYSGAIELMKLPQNEQKKLLSEENLSIDDCKEAYRQHKNTSIKSAFSDIDFVEDEQSTEDNQDSLKSLYERIKEHTWGAKTTKGDVAFIESILRELKSLIDT